MKVRKRRVAFGVLALLCVLTIVLLHLFPGQGQRRAAYLVTFSPAGDRIAALGEDLDRKEGWAGVWDVASGRLVQSLPLPARTVGLAFSPDGKALASGGWDGAVTIWDLATARERKSFTWFSSPVRGLLFLPGGERLAAGASEGRVVVGEVDSGNVLTRYERGLRFPVNQMVVSHDGRFLAVAGGLGSGAVSVWDLEIGEALKPSSLAGAWEPIAFAPKGAILAAGSPTPAAGPGLRLVDVESDRALASFPASSARCVAFSPDGQHVAWGGDDEMVSLGDVASGRILGAFAGHKRPADVFPIPLRSLFARLGVLGYRVQNTVWSVAFAPNGIQLASGSHDGTVWLWSPPTRSAAAKPIRPLVAPADTPGWLPVTEFALAIAAIVFSALAVRSSRKNAEAREPQVALSPAHQRLEATVNPSEN